MQHSRETNNEDLGNLYKRKTKVKIHVQIITQDKVDYQLVKSCNLISISPLALFCYAMVELHELIITASL